MLGNRLKNISADVIFCVWVQYTLYFLGWLRTKFSCEVHHRLYIMHQAINDTPVICNHCFTYSLEQAGDSLANVL